MATSLARVSAGISGVLLLLLVSMPGAFAEEAEAGACPVVAAAQGVQVMVTKSDDVVLERPSGLAVPVAQSCVDYAVGESMGFASNPYPGDTVVVSVPLARGVTGAPVPDYPAYAASRYPSVEKSEVDQPGYSLHARSSKVSSQARARSGADQDSADAGATEVSAESLVDPKARTSTARSRSHTQPLTINDVLLLGDVRSTALATAGADGRVARSSELRIGRSQVAGQVVEITPAGVKTAGQTSPLPGDDPAEVLQAAGVQIRYLTEEKTSRGVLSAGIEVIARQQVEGTAVTVHYTFGRAFAAAAEVGEGPSADLPDLDAPVSAAADSGAPEGEDASGPNPATGDATSGPAPAEPPHAADVPPSEMAPEQVAVAGDPVDMGMTRLYLMIVFGALAMFASGTLLRLLGVKTRWTS
jgi:hypothetical protein